MYRAHKMMTSMKNERILQHDHTIAILTASLVCTALLIAVDQADDKSSLVTMADAGFFNTFTTTRILL